MSLIQTIKQLYWTVTEQTVPANPDSGDQRLYIDSADHKLKRVNSSGTVTTIEGTASAVTRSGSTTDNHMAVWNGSSADSIKDGGAVISSLVSTLMFTIDGGGSAITTGVKGDMLIDFACTINAWTLLADTSGAIKIDIWRDTYASFPPTDADSLTNAHEPEIAASGTNAQDTSLGDWTSTAIVAGDILRFNVDSAATITRCLVALKVTRT